ncbi:MAG: helix-turn-helix transcriptional regulator [Clostridia bacterium]|nr:helix-turn-helix transcriptional regulator [Clostridia bacterium]MDW7661203.1 helix-turn-helix transcriptional regulator [Bacillota bacterium]
MDTKMLMDPLSWINDVGIKTRESFELDDILYNISVKLVEYRHENNLKQKDLARILDVSQAMVSKLESGDYNPTIELLWKISKKIDFEFSINFRKIQ